MNRFLKRGAWVLLALAVLGVAAWTVANAVGTRRLNATYRALEDAGFRTTSAHHPPPLPPGENAAPFYAAAFALLEESDEEADLLEEALDGGLAKLSPERRGVLDGLLARNAEAFEMLAKAAARPRCRFEREYSEGFHLVLPELSPAMQASKLLQLRAHVRASSGDAAGARRDVAAIFRLADAFREDSIVVSQLVRLVMMDRGLSAADRLVTAQTPEADLRAWAETIRGASVPPGFFEAALRQELAVVADFLRGLPFDPAIYEGLSTRRDLVPMYPLLRPLLKLDGAECLGAYRRLADAATLRHREAHEKARAIQAEFGEGSWRRPLRGLFLPSLSRCFLRCTATDARGAVLRAGLEAERIRRSTGAYPEKVETLDPATGAPLLYDRAAGRIASAASTKEDPIEWTLRSR